MRIAIASSSLLAVPLIEHLHESIFGCAGIITVPDAPKGRGRELQPSELAIWAASSNIPLVKYESREVLAEFIRAQNIDLVVTLSFGKILPQELLDLPTHGWLNVHFSSLPKFRGAAPVQRSILAGEPSIGLTVFKLDAGMDTGGIYEQADFQISPTETTEQLLSRLAAQSPTLVDKAICQIQTGTFPTPQDSERATYAEKISSDEGHVDWRQSGESISRLARALQENVGIWSEFRGSKLLLFSPTQTIVPSGATPGAILVSGAKNEPLTVACSDGALSFAEVKVSGKKRMSSAEFIRGARITDEVLA